MDIIFSHLPVLAQIGGNNLLSLGVVFLVIALVAYALGAKGVAGMSAGIGKLLLVIFLILAVLSIIVSLVR